MLWAGRADAPHSFRGGNDNDDFRAYRVSTRPLFGAGKDQAAKARPRERLAELFDVVGAFDLIEHIADDEVALRAIHRAVRDGGGVVIAVPQHPWLWSQTDVIAHHVRRYRRGELEDKIRRAGFRVAFSGSFTCLLLPLMVTGRMLARQGDATASRQASSTGARPAASSNCPAR